MTQPLTQMIPWFLAAGLCAGILSGLFGIGGGIILVPMLIFGLGYSQASANGTSLVALLLPVGILGVLTYYRAGKIGPTEIKAGLMIAVAMFFGAWVGAQLAIRLPEQFLRRLFSVFLVVVAFRLWFMKR